MIITVDLSLSLFRRISLCKMNVHIVYRCYLLSFREKILMRERSFFVMHDWQGI